MLPLVSEQGANLLKRAGNPKDNLSPDLFNFIFWFLFLISAVRHHGHPLRGAQSAARAARYIEAAYGAFCGTLRHLTEGTAQPIDFN